MEIQPIFDDMAESIESKAVSQIKQLKQEAMSHFRIAADSYIKIASILKQFDRIEIDGISSRSDLSYDSSLSLWTQASTTKMKSIHPEYVDKLMTGIVTEHPLHGVLKEFSDASLVMSLGAELVKRSLSLSEIRTDSMLFPILRDLHKIISNYAPIFEGDSSIDCYLKYSQCSVCGALPFGENRVISVVSREGTKVGICNECLDSRELSEGIDWQRVASTYNAYAQEIYESYESRESN